MTILICLSVGVSLTLYSKKLFNKWFNHLSIYTLSWTLFLVLYEIKLIRYTPLTSETWIVILISYIAFFLGILTLLTSRSLNNKSNKLFENNNNIDLYYLVKDDGRLIKKIIIILTIIAMFSAIQHWYVLINKFGSIAAVLIKANLIYRERISGEISGTIPYLYISGYIAVFLSAVYTAYKNKIGFMSILPIIAVILKDSASVGRAGIFIGTLLFIITFILFRHLLNSSQLYKRYLNKRQIIIAGALAMILVFASMTLVKEFRGSVESFKSSSRSLNKMKDIPILSPSIYMYFSSNVGVLSKYLGSDGENLLIGENTFLPVYNLISKFDIINHPEFYPKGYYIPIWTNSATYLRDLHADFGMLGVIAIPYLLGLIGTYYWFKFFENGMFKDLVILSFIYLIISFSVFYMITRSAVWLLSFIALLFINYVFEKHFIKGEVKSNLNIRDYKSF